MFKFQIYREMRINTDETYSYFSSIKSVNGHNMTLILMVVFLAPYILVTNSKGKV